MMKDVLPILKQACGEYYTHWKHMEGVREETGRVMYGLNDERIRLHEALLEASGLEREELRFLTDSMFDVENKKDFYNKVLQVVLTKTKMPE